MNLYQALLWLTGVLSIHLTVVRIYRAWRKEPPGPIFQIPLVGETLSMLAKGVPAWNRDLSKMYGSIYQAIVVGDKTVCVCDPGHIQQILLQDNELVCEDWPKATHILIGRGLPLLSGVEHAMLRKMLEPAFKISALQATLPKVIRAAEERCTAWANVGTFDAVLGMREIPLKVILLIMGYPEENITESLMEETAKMSHAFTKGLFSPAINLPGFDYYNSLRAREKLMDQMRGLVNDLRGFEREGKALEEVGERMMAMRTDDGVPLPDDDILDNFVVFLFSGQDTTANVMLHSLLELAQNPQVLTKLRAEQSQVVARHGSEISSAALDSMPYADAVIKEVMRLHPPVGCQFRRALKDFTLGEYTIRKGQKLILGLGCSYRADPRWAESGGDLALDRFYPERWQTDEGRKVGSHIPFAIGARMCIAWRLAMMELKVVLALWARKYEWELLDKNIKWDYFPFILPKGKLPVAFRQKS